jgi:Cu/Zn superoxide dismutase
MKEDAILTVVVVAVMLAVFLAMTGCTPPAERTKHWMPDTSVTIGDVPMILVEIDGRPHPLDRGF